MFSLKGILAQRRAVKQIMSAKRNLTDEEIKQGRKIEYVCAHYTMMGLSFIIKQKDGTITQRKVPEATSAAVAEMFLKLGE